MNHLIHRLVPIIGLLVGDLVVLIYDIKYVVIVLT